MLEYSKLRRWHNLAHAGAWPARVLIHVIGVWVRFREGADVAARFRTWHPLRCAGALSSLLLAVLAAVLRCVPAWRSSVLVWRYRLLFGWPRRWRNCAVHLADTAELPGPNMLEYIKCDDGTI